MWRKGSNTVDTATSRRRLLQRLSQQEGATRVIEAMGRVPREAFIPTPLRHMAYDDVPLPIGHDQTISQPNIVVMMTSALDLKPSDKVLEVGTGSGYQAAILAELAWRVITVERVPALARSARALLASLGYGARIDVRQADDALGCPQEAPFDAILVTAGSPKLPRALLDQMAPGGRLVIPVGSRLEQDMLHVLLTGDTFSIRSLGPCRFVPLVGPEAWQASAQGEELWEES